MSNSADDYKGAARGTRLLPLDLTSAQLAAAPVLVSIDELPIEELTEREDEVFAAALAT